MSSYEEILKSRTDLLRQVLAGNDPEEVLIDLCNDTEKAFPEVRCSVLSYDKQNHALLSFAGPRLPDFYKDAIDGVSVGYGVGSCGTAAHLQETVIVEDVFAHEFWAPFADLARQTGFRACWSEPIISGGGELFGTFAMYYDEVRKPTTAELELINGQAQLAALIFERLRDKLELEKMTQQFDYLADSQSDLICRFGTDFKFTFLNSSYKQKINVTGNDVQDHLVFDGMAAGDAKTLKEDLSKLTPEKASCTRYTMLNQGKGKTKLYQWMNYAEFDDLGNVVGYHSIGKDIDQSLNESRELKQKMIQYDQAVKISKIGYWICVQPDRKLEIVSSETCRIYGYNEEEMAGLCGSAAKDGWSLVHEDDRARYKAAIDTVWAGHGHLEIEFKAYHKDGSILYIREIAEPIFDEDDRVTELVGTTQDVTQQKKTEQELITARITSERANRAKSDFLANMSHELRTPLNAIIGFSELLKMTGQMNFDTAQVEEYANDVHEAGVHLLTVINDILDVAKIEADQMTFHEEINDLQTVFKSCISLVEMRANNNGLNLQMNLSDEMPALYADPTKFKQILLNLLSNSVKFTDKGGRISLDAFVEEGRIVIQVSDTGIGIAKEDQEVVFSKFGQVDAAYSRNAEGTGLGLSLVKLLAEAHQGEVELESEIGVGTTVTVTFPQDRTRYLN